MVIAEQESTRQNHPAGGQGPNSTREALARILAGETEGLFAREEIIDSWRESVSLGLLPQHFDLPTGGMSVVLAGEGCRVVARRAAGPLEEARLDELGVSPGFLWGIEHAG